jgi:hypothetical protein
VLGIAVSVARRWGGKAVGRCVGWWGRGGGGVGMRYEVEGSLVAGEVREAGLLRRMS